MLATAPYLSLHVPSLSYEEIPVKVLQASVKFYGKGADSQLPVFTVKSTEFFLQRSSEMCQGHLLYCPKIGLKTNNIAKSGGIYFQ